MSEITDFYRQPSPTYELGRHRDLARSSGRPGSAWRDRLKVEPPRSAADELDTSLDTLSRLAADAESAERIKECFDLYPELQPPADAVAR